MVVLIPVQLINTLTVETHRDHFVCIKINKVPLITIKSHRIRVTYRIYIQ